MVGPAGEVNAGAGVVEHPLVDDDAHGPVELAVAEGVEPVPGDLAEVAGVLADRAHPAAVLGGLPASTRAALSHLADFFITPVQQSAPENPAKQ